MTLSEMESIFRKITGDKDNPPLCCSDIVRERFLEGEREACLRKLLIRDFGSYLCKLHAVPGQESVYTDSKIIRINKASIFVNGIFSNYADIIDESKADETGDWRNEKQGVPKYAIDFKTFLRLIPAPDKNIEIRLDVYRYPMRDKDEELELQDEHHKNIVNYAAALYFFDNDADQRDEEKGTRLMSMFNRAYGPQISTEAVRNSAVSRIHTIKKWY